MSMSGVGGPERGGQTGRTSRPDEAKPQEETQKSSWWGWLPSPLGGGHTVQQKNDAEAIEIPEQNIIKGIPLGTREVIEIRAECKLQAKEDQGVHFKDFSKDYEVTVFGTDESPTDTGIKLMELLAVLAELGEQGGGISPEDQQRYEEHPMQFMLELNCGDNPLADKIEHHGDRRLDPEDPESLAIRTLLIDIQAEAKAYFENNIAEATADYSNSFDDDFANCVAKLDKFEELAEKRLVNAEKEAILGEGFTEEDFNLHLKVSEEMKELERVRAYLSPEAKSAYNMERYPNDFEKIEQMSNLAGAARSVKTDAGNYGLTADEAALEESLKDQYYALSKQYVEGLALDYFNSDPIAKEAFSVVYKLRETIIAQLRENGVDEKEIDAKANQEISSLRKSDSVHGQEIDAYFRAMENRMGVILGITGFEYRDKVIDGYDLGFALMGCVLGEDAARSVYAQGTNVKRAAVAGAAIGGAVVLGPTAAATYGIGGIFAYHMTKRAIVAGKARIEGAGLLYDIKGAQRDKEIRTVHLQKIFAQGFSPEEQMRALEELHANNLLFQENYDELLDFNPEVVQAFFAANELEREGLPSRTEIAEMREPFLRILSLLIDDPEHDYRAYRAEDQLAALLEMEEKKILFKEDLLRADSAVQREFLEKSAYESIDELPSIEKRKKMMRILEWKIRGTDRTAEERFVQILEMMDKGVFFQEDLVMLKTKANNGDDMARRLEIMAREYLAENSIEVKDLPTTKKYYKEESALRDEHDALRRPILDKLNNLKDPEFLAGMDPQLTEEEIQERIYDNLKLLWDQGICFDTDIEGVDQAVLNRLREYVDGHWTGYALDSLPSREDFYASGYQKRLIKAAYMSAEAVASTVTRPFDIATTDIISGTLVGLKGVFVSSIEGLEDTYGTLTVTEPTRSISERVAEMMPPDVRIRKNAQWCVNKGIGGMKWGIVGGAVGAWVGSIFPIAGTVIGAKIGGLVGIVGGTFCSDGYTRQIPAGGLIRGAKFSTIGALLGAVVPMIGMAVAGGLAVAGVIGIGTCATICTGGIALIVPLIIIGMVGGWKYAGMTGKDNYQETVTDSYEKAMSYEAPAYLEETFFARAASLA